MNYDGKILQLCTERLTLKAPFTNNIFLCFNQFNKLSTISYFHLWKLKEWKKIPQQTNMNIKSKKKKGKQYMISFLIDFETSNHFILKYTPLTLLLIFIFIFLGTRFITSWIFATISLCSSINPGNVLRTRCNHTLI